MYPNPTNNIGEGNGNSSVLAWRIPGMGEPGGLPSMGLHRGGYDWHDLAAAAAAAAAAEQLSSYHTYVYYMCNHN